MRLRGRAPGLMISWLVLLAGVSGCGAADATGVAGAPGTGGVSASGGSSGRGGSPGGGGSSGAGGAIGIGGNGGGNGSTGGSGGDASGGSGGDGIGGGGGRDERPWAGNTGPHSPELLIPQSPGEILVDGTVIENADLSGTIEVKANDVTIRNFRINGGLYGIRIENGRTGIVFEDGEIYNVASAAIIGVGYTARRLHIHDSDKDGLKPQGSTSGSTLIESCFIEKLGRSPDAHADGIKSAGSNAPLTIRGNNIHMPYPGTPSYPGPPYKSNSTIKFDLGQVDGNLVDGNWLEGGNYTIFCIQDSGRVDVTNNVFGRYNGGWADAKEDRRIRTGSCGSWVNNRWEDDDTLIP